MSLTHETLMRMSKDVLAGMVLVYKERFDSTFSAMNDELKELKTNFPKRESHLAISRTVNDKLTDQLILVERKCWANKQYSHQECLDISGISQSIQDDNLENCVVEIFKECDIKVDATNIEACHHLKLKARLG